MKFHLLVPAALTSLLILGYDGSTLISSSSAAAPTGCQVDKPPAGADKTTIKSWIDPRPCDWAQKFPLFAPPATGDGSLERVQNAGNLTICAETDQPPGVYADRNHGQDHRLRA